ncbi:restriction endonuclease [Luteimonas sp. 22616]|uniref:restriction endonuclease n=1 Tax=Luteimonas sp. 22616 TaxID=3453951 RepID=UPI003F86013E
MGDSLVRVGTVQPRYTATGRLSSYSLELWHDGLGEHREVKSSDPDVLGNKAEAVLLKWEEKWQTKQQKLALLATVESAMEETEAAQAALVDCEALLHWTLSVDDRVDWEALKAHKDFSWNGRHVAGIVYKGKSNEPSVIEAVKPPREPRNGDFQPPVRWFHHLIPGAIRKLEEEERKKLQAARRAFDVEITKCKAEEERRKELLANQKDEFGRAYEAYLSARKATDARVDAFREGWSRLEPESVIEHADLVLGTSRYPAWMKMDYNVGYDPDPRILVVDYRLPSPDEIPTLERVSFVRSRNERVEKHITDARKKKLFDSICYQIALRTVHELLEADEVNALSAITFNGWVEAVNPATGKEERNCILTVQAGKDEFLTFDLSRVDPKICFKALKGVAANSLTGLAPVRPILQLKTDDARFVSSREIADSLDDSVNLAAMSWEDFEHLVRELFSKVFSTEGAQVHVTQASRDGGVDAIAFDPDPIKGGKIVIQAKRYTNVVGVGAVRDLYGTVLNEGANRGILVTTSNYGPDAHTFAQGKPLTLLNGNNLLSLLAEHGHQARIDINEARQLLKSRTS